MRYSCYLILNALSEGSAKVASMMRGSRIVVEETIAQSLQGGSMEGMARIASGWHILETSESIKAHYASAKLCGCLNGFFFLLSPGSAQFIDACQIEVLSSDSKRVTI